MEDTSTLKTAAASALTAAAGAAPLNPAVGAVLAVGGAGMLVAAAVMDRQNRLDNQTGA